MQSNEGIFPRRKGKRKRNIKEEHEKKRTVKCAFFRFIQGIMYWKERPINKMLKNTRPIIGNSENKSRIYERKTANSVKTETESKKMRKETIYKRKRGNQPGNFGKQRIKKDKGQTGKERKHENEQKILGNKTTKKGEKRRRKYRKTKARENEKEELEKVFERENEWGEK